MYSKLLLTIKELDTRYICNIFDEYEINHIKFNSTIVVDRLVIRKRHGSDAVFYMSFFENKIVFSLFSISNTVTYDINYLNSFPDFDSSDEEIQFQISASLDEHTLFYIRAYQIIKNKGYGYESYYI